LQDYNIFIIFKHLIILKSKNDVLYNIIIHKESKKGRKIQFIIKKEHMKSIIKKKEFMKLIIKKKHTKSNIRKRKNEIRK